MSNSLFKRPKSQPSRGRNGHDMSFHRSFTAPCGMLLPVAKDFANPGDKYRLNSSLFIRTEALQSAAFQKFKVHVDWFFTPIKQLYSLWPEFFYSTNDVNSSIFRSVYDIGIKPSLPVFNLKNYVKDASKFVNGASDWYTDNFGTPLAFNFRRLWDLLGYGSLSVTASSNIIGDIILPLLDFLTYHRIYYSHYNKTDWFKNNPDLFNVDKFYNNTAPITSSLIDDIVSTIHYRPWRTDYFTNIMPQPLMSTQFANVLSSPITSGNVDIRNYINSELKNSSRSAVPSIATDTNVNPNNTYASINITDDSTAGVPSSISAGDLRAVFALDKLLRVSSFAGSHYDEQTRAHFGYQMPQGISEEVYFLGSQSTDVTIGEVVATASTGADGAGTTLGDIAGKGFGMTNGQGDLTFTCPSHGYIMAIFSIEPLQTYSSTGMEQFNRYQNMLDFYHEEFDNLGMQPFLASTLDCSLVDDNTELLGWQYRWSELKTKYDVVNEGFWDTSRYTWVATKQLSNPAGYVQPLSTPEDLFLISPTYANSIFLQPFNAHKSAGMGTNRKWDSIYFNSQECYGADPFLIDADFKMFKTSIMSTYSLPKF